MNTWIVAMLRQFLAVITPQLRDDVFVWIGEQQEKAKKTPNPFDDLFFKFLKMLVGGDTD